MIRGLFSVIIVASGFSFASCHSERGKQKIPITRGFYYWRSVFKNIAAEQRILKEAKVTHLYIKFFDVDWNYRTSKPFPLAQIQFADNPDSSLQIIPVVFITNRCLSQIDSSTIPSLAENIARLLASTSSANNIKNISELQIDCDWTDKTKDKYFYLLRELDKHSFFSNKLLSVTIRLYQAKYKQRTGVPPADKGLLMAYNMGNIKNPETANSILDPAEMEKYIKDIRSYPLHLDLALPLFSWYVWFKYDESYKGLIHDYDLPALSGFPIQEKNQDKYIFTRDYDTLGFSFQKGDILRKEASDLSDIVKAGELFAKHFPGDSLTLSCFHLDSLILKKYPADVLEKIFNSLQH
jgi:hypothetical protein